MTQIAVAALPGADRTGGIRDRPDASG